MQTIEAVIEKDGKVRLLEDVRLPQARRALLTILDDEPKEIKSESWANNQDLANALGEAYTNDADEEEKEFLRLLKIKQSQNLDEWK
jgi:hypothetical protein